MPLPKRRHSNQRTAKRRTHYKIELPNVVECERCHAPHVYHHACPSCGFYRGRLVLDVKSREKKEE